jgi:hypothetical protein
MKLPPYTFSEARTLKEKHQHIIGLSYDADEKSAVDMVVVAPYEPASRNRFLMLFLMLNDAEAALSLDYNGNQYDVIVISGSADANGMQHRNLHNWLIAQEQVMEAQTSE